MHRRAFLEKELLRLGEVFYLDVVSYSVMSNHYHIVLFIDQEAMKTADAAEIVSKWHEFHKGNAVSVKFLEGVHEISQWRDDYLVYINRSSISESSGTRVVISQSNRNRSKLYLETSSI